MKNENIITFNRPDDWHLHVRNGDVLAAVIGDTSRDFGRAIIMPNLSVPITTSFMAAAYRAEISSQLADKSNFSPLMTCYLTDTTNPDDLREGLKSGVYTAAKLYPAGATTNSDRGVTDIKHLDGVFDVLSDLGCPLLVHGEVVDDEIDIFDREKTFIKKILIPLRSRHKKLKIVFEHITTKQAVEYIEKENPSYLAATITPHHLAINRNAMFHSGIRPHMYCLPIAKREEHRQTLLRAACSGDQHFFLGTDSAPHTRENKESSCGCAGIYNSPSAISVYLQIFEQSGTLDKFNNFASKNGPAFYDLPINSELVTYRKNDKPLAFPNLVVINDDIEVFSPPFNLYWAKIMP
jgi:dihydroorotase